MKINNGESAFQILQTQVDELKQEARIATEKEKDKTRLLLELQHQVEESKHETKNAVERDKQKTKQLIELQVQFEEVRTTLEKEKEKRRMVDASSNTEVATKVDRGTATETIQIVQEVSFIRSSKCRLIIFRRVKKLYSCSGKLTC